MFPQEVWAVFHVRKDTEDLILVVFLKKRYKFVVSQLRGELRYPRAVPCQPLAELLVLLRPPPPLAGADVPPVGSARVFGVVFSSV